MHVPRPTEGHERLARLAGRWVGQETMMPSPWMPEKKNATGKIEGRLALDGLMLVTDYHQEQNGEVTFRGHGVYGYDEKTDRYTMYWFDSTATEPSAPVYGKWEGDTLIFEKTADGRTSRYVYRLESDDVYHFRIEQAEADKAPVVFMETVFTRAR